MRRKIYCHEHDEPVYLIEDFAMDAYYCPRTNCTTKVTEEQIVEQSCQRCGEGPDPDLRTLWMACLYEMNEIGLPFEQYAIKGIPQRVSGYKESPFVKGGVPEFEPVPDADEYLYRFYLLRVCKGCRSEWMGAIASWFGKQRDPRLDGDGNYALTEAEAL